MERPTVEEVGQEDGSTSEKGIKSYHLSLSKLYKNLVMQDR